MATKSPNATAAARNPPRTRASRQPLSAAVSTAVVTSVRPAVKLAAPHQSNVWASGSREGRIASWPSRPASADVAITRAKMARQPNAADNCPATTGPSTSPMPKLVPSRLNARTRASSSNSWASAAAPPAKMAAPPSPCRPRSRSKTRMSGAAVNPPEASRKTAMPIRKTRLRPWRSAIAPAAISALPKASMNAFVTQARAEGAAPKASAMLPSATAGPVNVMGIVPEAMQTAARTRDFLARSEERWVIALSRRMDDSR